ncbi:quinoprotein relay system zinc metallohydrolase 2 [Roseivivax marinus]|uniref:quinoprotein relay system zinc metallohydrolase 2 n=1 Tax=Roseivivax marinus TaxID=1379903 RepID=UPI00273D983F|nr:quinoprotein relay system zinc metallohydrolase 2 [Roseivivax marinus]
MFEAILTLCLTLDAGTCRDTLLPGYEAERRASCAEALAAAPPDPARFAPLAAPGNATCREAGAALEVEEIAPGVFVHSGAIEEPAPGNLGDVSNMGFVIGGASVAVIDAGGSRAVGEGLWRAIRARTDLPVSHLVLTHMHPDHVLGAGPFVFAGAEVVGHAGLGRAMSERRQSYLDSFARLIGPAAFLGSDVPAVDDEVEESTRIDLGSRVLTVTAWPAAHTGTDVSVRDEETGILFAGDLVFDRHTPALDGSLRGWQSVLEDLQATEAAGVVPGHGAARLPWPEGAEPLVRYLETLAADTRAALDAGMRLGDAVEVIAEDEREAWALFDAYNARNATVAFTELEWE